jgi:hypothetical protein
MTRTNRSNPTRTNQHPIRIYLNILQEEESRTRIKNKNHEQATTSNNKQEQATTSNSNMQFLRNIVWWSSSGPGKGSW